MSDEIREKAEAILKKFFAGGYELTDEDTAILIEFLKK